MPIIDSLMDESTDARRAVRRVTRRLIPFVFLCYVVAYIDRVNVGFAAAALQRDLGLTDTQYRIGAGLFFLGYCLFEIPSNLILERVGARRWIARIMIGWGIASMGMIFVYDAPSFYLGASHPRHRGSRLLPRHRPVSHLLGARRESAPDRRALHDGRPSVDHRGRADLGRAPRARRRGWGSGDGNGSF